MTKEIRVPTLGESVTEATVAQWMKKVGDTVSIDENLVELETDKVSLEVPSSVAGVIREIKVSEGTTVGLDAVLCIIDDAAQDHAQPTMVNASLEQTQKNGTFGNQRANLSTMQETVQAHQEHSPAVRKIVADNNLEVASVAGSGKDGRLLKADVMHLQHNEASKQAQSTDPASMQETRISYIKEGDDENKIERVRMSKLRSTISRRLKAAQNTAAILTTFNDVDMTNIIALRKEYKETFEKKHGVKLGFMGLFAKAVIAALKEIPEINAEIDNDEIVYKNYYNIGIAVGTDKGLVVPVVRGADNKTISEIEKEIYQYGQKAREGRLGIEDMTGGTFTISNGGVYGSLLSTPILNAPQSGILGMHRTEQRPVVIDGKIEIRSMMYLALSYDHRIVDGKEAVTFLVRVKQAIEDPQRLILDI